MGHVARLEFNAQMDLGTTVPYNVVLNFSK